MMLCFKPISRNIPLLLFIILISLQASQVNSSCSRGCDLAIANYIVPQGTNLTLISQLFGGVPVPQLLSWNPGTLPDQDTVLAGDRIEIPFICDCINGEFLAHVFNYSISPGDTYDSLSNRTYGSLTTTAWLQGFNRYSENNIPQTGFMNVTVNCSCGDRDVSRDYGLFMTWPIIAGDILESVASANNLTSNLVRSYNPTANFSSGTGLLFIPARGEFNLE